MRNKRKHSTPPRLAEKLLLWFLKDELAEEVLGDLDEKFYSTVEKYSTKKARRNYWYQAFNYLRPFAFRFFKFKNSNTMIYHNLKVGLRFMLSNRTYSLVNIGGLAVSLGVCIVIFQYIYFELSYDKFHQDHKNLYRVVLKERSGTSESTTPSTFYGFGTAAVEEIPEIQRQVRKQRFNRGAVVLNPINRSVFHEEVNNLLFVDDSFFDAFNFPIQTGDKEKLFSDTYSIVITAKTANKYFGLDNPIGKTLEISGPPSPGTYTITGVLEDPPLNSHLRFNFLISMKNYIEKGWGGAVKDRGEWNGFSVVTYLQLKPNSDPLTVSTKLEDLLYMHSTDNQSSGENKKQVLLQPISDIYLGSNELSDPGFISTMGNREDIRIYFVISVFILLIAWINYVNLSTAKSMARAKEVGIRKSIGAFRKQLISQFILEAILVNIASAALSIIIALSIIPYFNSIVGKDIELNFLNMPIFWFIFVSIIVMGAIVSSLYPAFILSSYRPISMLRGKGSVKVGSINLRRGLITFQFLTSLLLISATYIVHKQTSLMKNYNLNIDLDQILILKTQQINSNNESASSNFEFFKNEIMKDRFISAVTTSRVPPGEFGVNSYKTQESIESTSPYTRSIFAGVDFPTTFGLEFMAGNTFSNTMPEEEVAIINESALQAFGFSTAESALAEKLFIGPRTLSIVGVVKNFNWHSLKESQTPYIIELSNIRLHPYIALRANVNDAKQLIAKVESAFNSSFPDQPFDYFFADDNFNKQYQSETQFSKTFLFFAIVAIIIGCVGLFALVAHTAATRTKEISIRKVLGASVNSLTRLLCKEYLILIVIAVIIASPAVLIWGRVWLNNYSLQTNLGVDTLLLPAIALIIISLITVGNQALKTVRVNPAKSLRSE